jgi:predicted dehydrogenase
MYKTCLVGLGRIGATYDIDATDQSAPRSHLGAIMAHPNFAIARLIDQNEHAFDLARNHWSLSTNLFSQNLDLHPTSYDVCVFATPPENRIAELTFALKQQAKIIVFEKPLTESYAQALALYNLWEESPHKPHIIVNFTRRFDPRYRALKASLTTKPHHIICTYSKGLENYASHHIDLVQDWFGTIASVQTFGNMNAENPSFSCKIDETLHADFIGLPHAQYDIFDMQLWFDHQRIDIINGGTEMIHALPKSDLYYKNYAHLVSEKKPDLQGLVLGMPSLYDTLDEILRTPRTPDISRQTLKEAVNVTKVVEAVRHSAINQGKTVEIGDIKA